MKEIYSEKVMKKFYIDNYRVVVYNYRIIGGGLLWFWKTSKHTQLLRDCLR